MIERPAAPQTKTVTPAAGLRGALRAWSRWTWRRPRAAAPGGVTSALPAHGGHLGDRAEAGPEHADEVRAEVPERALLPPPRAC